MHRSFAHRHVARDWFNFDPLMLTAEPPDGLRVSHWHASVITEFGGTRPLAEAIGVDPKRAIHWVRRGIPSKYWPCIEEIAAEKSIEITAVKLSKLPVAA